MTSLGQAPSYLPLLILHTHTQKREGERGYYRELTCDRTLHAKHLALFT